MNIGSPAMLDDFAALTRADRRALGSGRWGPAAARCEVFTVARFDRLRVLSTELKRLVVAGAPVALRFGVAPPLADARLASVLCWV